MAEVIRMTLPGKVLKTLLEALKGGKEAEEENKRAREQRNEDQHAEIRLLRGARFGALKPL